MQPCMSTLHLSDWMLPKGRGPLSQETAVKKLTKQCVCHKRTHVVFQVHYFMCISVLPACICAMYVQWQQRPEEGFSPLGTNTLKHWQRVQGFIHISFTGNWLYSWVLLFYGSIFSKPIYYIHIIKVVVLGGKGSLALKNYETLQPQFGWYHYIPLCKL